MPVPYNADRASFPVIDAMTTTLDAPTEYKSWICLICGWIYNEAEGAPDDGLAPGTRWADVPTDWRCPECDVSKEDFVLSEF
ncbi:rubredoxin [Pandoraea pulmonicola]|uniref:Rubredoxin n=2 Tax=Pandoraea pulmonicola TaxID=93221 RepID=A0AAJ4ZH32_PANPU|nr:rubredoxin [Pandoraea pulmonicola]SUA93091.1 Rubredoxin [Pandoraea pulmonicola]